MGDSTKISWAHHTASPWYGCAKVSAGCEHCYAEQWAKKLHVEWGNGKPRMRSKSFEANVRKWNRAVEPFKNWSNYERPRIFPSLCDPFDHEVPIDWFADYLHVIHESTNLDHLLITKRPENVRARLAFTLQHYALAPSINEAFCAWIESWVDGCPPENVWLGVSVENQQTADERIPLLDQIPAKVRWLSVEPLLEPIRFRTPADMLHVDWVVVGGESGKHRRDCGVEAIVDVARQCQAAGVSAWVKQASALRPGQQGNIPDEVWKLKELPRL